MAFLVHLFCTVASPLLSLLFFSSSQLKVQAIAEPVKAPEACTLLCKEAALVAEKLEGALKDPYQVR